MIPQDDDSRTQPFAFMHPSAEAVFIGNHCNFSASLIAATVQELDGIPSVLLSSFAEFRKGIEAGLARPSLVVLDEPTMRGLSGRDRDFLLTLEGIALGIAFGNIDFAIACQMDRAIALRGASIFPLDVRFDVWLSVLRLIAHGGTFISPEILTRSAAAHQTGHPVPHAAADGMSARAAMAGDCVLTQRQMDVMRLVADGHSNKRIAEILNLSIHTVKLHLHNGSMRLGARNRTEAAMRFLEIEP